MTPTAPSKVSVLSTVVAEAAPGERVLTLCSMQIGRSVFGVDTRTIKEVLPRGLFCKVPLSASYIAGIVPYRGEVLTAVDVRSLLGMPVHSEPSCVVVYAENAGEEQFGIAVDSVGTVVRVDAKMYTPNPSTLDIRSAALYDGVFQTSSELLIVLKLSKFQPSVLEQTVVMTMLPRPESSLESSQRRIS